MTIISLALGYQAIVLVVFGVIGLMLFPRQLLGRTKKSSKKPPLSTQELMVYRICGLWVASSGVASCTLAACQAGSVKSQLVSGTDQTSKPKYGS